MSQPEPPKWAAERAGLRWANERRAKERAERDRAELIDFLDRVLAMLEKV